MAYVYLNHVYVIY